MTRFARLIFCCYLFLSVGYIFAAPPVTENLSSILEKAMPAVVNVKVQLNPQIYSLRLATGEDIDSRYLVSIGSGVIIDAAKGYIITNAHVVKDAKNITITLNDSRKFTAKLLGLDVSSDLALLQIHADSLTQIPFANSNQLKVGDPVAAIGSPFGLDQTVTSGIVSALGRNSPKLSSAESFIQTDASINRGNSGGALIDSSGRLVGINTAILSSEGGNGGNIGIGFAIPANTVKAIAEQIIEFGDVKRGYLGVLVQDLTPALATALATPKTTGALVSSVSVHSPAAIAGLLSGDIIIAVNGDPIQSASQLIADVGMLRAGHKITLTVWRKQTAQKLSLVLASLEKLDEERQNSNPYFYGTVMRDYAEFNPALGEINGVQILDVAQDSNAYRDGLNPGDVILSANLERTDNIKALFATAEKNSNKPLLLNILRNNGALFITIQAVRE